VAAPDALAWLDEHESEAIDRLVDWLRIPSISTGPDYKADTARAAAACCGLTDGGRWYH
jgi:hypothetical protein